MLVYWTTGFMLYNLLYTVNIKLNIDMFNQRLGGWRLPPEANPRDAQCTQDGRAGTERRFEDSDLDLGGTSNTCDFTKLGIREDGHFTNIIIISYSYIMQYYILHIIYTQWSMYIAVYLALLKLFSWALTWQIVEKADWYFASEKLDWPSSI